MIKIDIDYDIIIKASDVKKIEKNTPGIYVLLDKLNTPIYIGQSKNMKARLLAHTRGYTNSLEFHQDINKVAIIFESDINKRLLAEKYLISTFETLKNVHQMGSSRYKMVGFVGVNPFGSCPYVISGNYICGKRAHENGFCNVHGGNGVSVASIQEKAVENYLKKLKEINQ